MQKLSKFQKTVSKYFQPSQPLYNRTAPTTGVHAWRVVWRQQDDHCNNTVNFITFKFAPSSSSRKESEDSLVHSQRCGLLPRAIPSLCIDGHFCSERLRELTSFLLVSRSNSWPLGSLSAPPPTASICSCPRLFVITVFHLERLMSTYSGLEHCGNASYGPWLVCSGTKSSLVFQSTQSSELLTLCCQQLCKYCQCIQLPVEPSGVRCKLFCTFLLSVFCL